MSEPEATTFGCCAKYYECIRCEELFCKHGTLVYIPRGKVPQVIPLSKMCPACEELEAKGE